MAAYGLGCLIYAMCVTPNSAWQLLSKVLAKKRREALAALRASEAAWGPLPSEAGTTHNFLKAFS